MTERESQEWVALNEVAQWVLILIILCILLNICQNNKRTKDTLKMMWYAIKNIKS